MLLAKMAIRNLVRNLRRTLITGVTITIGLAYLVIASGMGDGIHSQMIEAGISTMAGHVVVQAPGWQEKREHDLTVPATPEVVGLVEEAVPGATVVTRVFLQGLLTSPSGSIGAALTAVEPAEEARVNQVADKVVGGAWLEPGEEGGVVLGVTLAETLDVGLEDKVVLMTQAQGDIQSRLFRVRGLFRVGIDEVDGFAAYIPLGDAQAILGIGQDVNQVAVHLDSARQTHETTRALEQALDERDLQVLPWQEALPELHQWVVVDDAGLYVFLLIIAVIVGMGITNTVLMSVLERMREFGVLMAIGTGPLRMAGLVLMEAALLGTVAVTAGVLLGVLGNWPLQVYGLDFSMFMGETMEAAGVPMEAHIYSDLSASKVLLFALLAWLMTFLASIYPAWKAATLSPVQNLQHQ